MWVLIILAIALAMLWIGRAPETFPLFQQYTERRKEHQKQQWVRLLDILVLGPLGLLLAYQLWNAGWRGWSVLLVAYSALTMVYNYGNYRLNLE